MKQFWTVTLGYFLFSLVYFILETIDPGLIITLVAKALPVSILIFYLLLNLSLTRRENYFIVLGLLFSLGGDLLLQWSNRNPDFFITGLLSFLLTQIFYILHFFSGGNLTTRLKKIWPALLIMPAYGISLVWWLAPGLGDMLLPVSVYALALVTMGIAGLSRIPAGPRTSAFLIASGALLFVSSDSMIAINRFGHSFALSRPAILLTYFLAQYVIVQGVLIHWKNRMNPDKL